MENYNLLHKNSYGQVTKCNCYNHIQLAFGNVLIDFYEDDFITSSNFFSQLAQKHSLVEAVNPHKKIMLKTDFKTFSLLLSVQEIHWLNQLFSQSILMMKVYHLFKTPINLV